LDPVTRRPYPISSRTMTCRGISGGASAGHVSFVYSCSAQ
jgi:hypothetical protein